MSEPDYTKVTDTEILNWLDMNLSYDHMIEIFGYEDGIASDGGPRALRNAVIAKMVKGEF